MIYSLTGTVAERREGFIVVNVTGVGYKVFVTKSFSKEVSVGTEIFCYTHHHIREDISDLYGFADEEARELFAMLLTISGIGPRSALSVLDVASIDELKSAISADNAKLLKQVAGIGPKLAERITLELKNKLSGSIGTIQRLEKDIDVLEGLISLGYTRFQASAAIKDISDTIIDPRERIKVALKILSK